jgi:hypothetical protein
MSKNNKNEYRFFVVRDLNPGPPEYVIGKEDITRE